MSVLPALGLIGSGLKNRTPSWNKIFLAIGTFEYSEVVLS